MNDRGHLDWVCIGAQKAGTSTLYRLLRDHPEIRIPPDKEVPIFDREVTDAEVDAYMAGHFAGATERCGTVTPHYMFSPEIADRMRRYVPDALIIALLRDPVTRAFSHYRMNVRRGHEVRTFDDAVSAQIAAWDSGSAEDPHSEVDTYVRRGHYAPLLTRWFEQFGPARVLVLFTDDLDRSTFTAVREVERFLGVAVRQEVVNGVRYHEDPPPHRLSGIRRPAAAALRRVGVLDRMDPERRKRVTAALERRAARWFPAPERRIDPDTAAALRAHFADDERELAALLGRPLPWSTA